MNEKVAESMLENLLSKEDTVCVQVFVRPYLLKPLNKAAYDLRVKISDLIKVQVDRLLAGKIKMDVESVRSVRLQPRITKQQLGSLEALARQYDCTVSELVQIALEELV